MRGKTEHQSQELAILFEKQYKICIPMFFLHILVLASNPLEQNFDIWKKNIFIASLFTIIIRGVMAKFTRLRIV